MKSAFAVHKEQMEKKKPGTLKIKLKSSGKVTKGKKQTAKAKNSSAKKQADQKNKTSNPKNDKKSSQTGKKRNPRKPTSKTTVKSGAKGSATTGGKKLSGKSSPGCKSPESSTKKDEAEAEAKTGRKSPGQLQNKSPVSLSAKVSTKVGSSPQETSSAKSKSAKSKLSKESVQKTENKSTSKRAATTPPKHPSEPQQKGVLSESSLAKEENTVDLTPNSELKATKQASKDRMSVKITPLKSGQDISSSQRKRKSSVANSKDAKKLKIKLLPSKLGKKSNINTPGSDQKKQESPQIVNFSTPQNELSGTNGPTSVNDSREESALLFKWLISPVTPQNFFDNLWEKKPLLVRRHKPEYFKGIFSTELFSHILKKNDIQFGRHLDITSYTDGKRETHNPEGRAHAPVVWDYFNNGCSVRLLNPQTYSDTVWKLLSVLQENFGSFCGANVYLTPAGTQGFAPHYDDIEAFILQLEGKKRWRLYSPQSDSEILPRFSSDNLTDADVGKPILDTVLEEGDVLYFPRGFIHQATPPPDTHSLHLTVSTCQRNTWGDLLEKLIGASLQTAIEEDVDFRVSLPRDYLSFMGVVNSDLEDDRRTVFVSKIRSLFQKLSSYAPIDDAVDQMAKELMHSSLPPVLSDEEEACMIYGSDVSFVNGKVVSNSNQLTEETEIRLIRRGCLRLVTEENEVRIFHSMENPRVYRAKPEQYFVIPPESAPGVEFLIFQYPKFVKVGELCLEGELQGKQLDLATLLFEKALIRTKYALHTNRRNSFR